MPTQNHRNARYHDAPRVRVGHADFYALVALTLFACGNDTDSDDPVTTPLDPPELEILSVETSVGEPVEPPSGSTLVLGCDRSLSVAVGPNPSRGRLKNWLLRPPEACDGRPQCGYLRVELDLGAETLRTSSASTFVTLRVPTLPEGTRKYSLGAHLLDDTGATFKLANSEPVSATASIRLADAMGCDGGAGGAGASGGDGGLGGQAGASVARDGTPPSPQN